MVVFLHGTALNIAGWCSFYFFSLSLACFYFALCFFHRIVHLFALPLCLVSRLRAMSQCREFIVLPRHSGKSSHSETKEYFFKRETMLSTASCLYSARYKGCPFWHDFCLWRSMNWEIMTKEQIGACWRGGRASRANVQRQRTQKEPMERSYDLVQDIQQASGSREQGLPLRVRYHISAPELLQFTDTCIWLDLMILSIFTNLNDPMTLWLPWAGWFQFKLALTCSAVKCSSWKAGTCPCFWMTGLDAEVV